MDTNQTVMVGRLTRDAELKMVGNGFAITTFSIAIGERFKKGEAWEDYTNFFDVKALGKTGESVAKYLTKGKQVAITAHAKQERWDDANGQKRSNVVFMAESIQLIGSKDSGNTSHTPDKDGEYTDDIPF